MNDDVPVIDARARMDKAIDHAKEMLKGIRTSRPPPWWTTSASTTTAPRRR
jgi:hypothetical protein